MPEEPLSVDPERAGTLHQAFESQVRKAPSAPAVRCGSEQLSYAELDARSNRLAHFLRDNGLRTGGLVAVSLGRTPDLIVAMLAVLKAGGAYVPVEPGAPESVIRHVLAAAQPFVIVTWESYRVRLADAVNRPVVCLDTEAARIGGYSSEPFDVGVDAEDLACVFFTSGSTGSPKGALIEHRNLLSAFEGWQEAFRFTSADRHLQSTTFEFDVFTADWIRALCSGGVLVMAQRNFTLDRTADPADLHALILDERITVMETNVLTIGRLSAHLRPLGLKLGEVRLLCVGAEKWYVDDQADLQEYLGDGVRVVNVYGVAEASVDSAYFEVSGLRKPVRRPGRVSLIGRAFPGTHLSVVDPATGADVAAGVPGEIRIAGPGVGRGYLGDHELTAARFSTVRIGSEAVPGYRTGDVGLLRQDGLVQYIGRLDAAGTLAGVVHLARIEGVVRERPQVRECLIADIESASGSPLRVAYVVASDPSSPLNTETLRSAAADAARSIPVRPIDAIVPLPSLPRTRAGKIDRANLPLPAPLHHAEPEAVAGRARSGKGWTSSATRSGKGWTYDSGDARAAGCLAVLFAPIIALAALQLTDTFWHYSMDLTLVPGKWHWVFRLLYGFEALSFGVGVTFLFLGRPALTRLGRPRGRTTAAHLSIVWLLAAWWPQDNAYRTTQKDDWARQAAWVYLFNVSLMIAAALVAWFLTSTKKSPEEPSRR